MSNPLSLFPPSSAAQDGQLTIDGCRAEDLAEAFGTPVLVVAEQGHHHPRRHLQVAGPIEPE
jgi:diaminopimelate decarboxylase